MEANIEITSCVVFDNCKYVVGDIVVVHTKSGYEPYTGRIRDIYAQSFALDVSKLYESKIITIPIDDVLKIV